MKKFLLCLVLIVGCHTNLQREYVEADDKTLEVVKPAIEKWLKNEPGNVCRDEEDVNDWHMKLHSWRLRVIEARRALAEQEKQEQD